MMEWIYEKNGGMKLLKSSRMKPRQKQWKLENYGILKPRD